MFNNLLYIYSKDNGVINKYINENENNFEIKKLKYELNKKDNELKILQPYLAHKIVFLLILLL